GRSRDRPRWRLRVGATRRPGSLLPDSGSRSARISCHLPQRLDHLDVDRGPLLGCIEGRLGHRLAGITHHILGWQSVECEHDHVLTVLGSIDESRDRGLEALEGLYHMVLHHVQDHRTARAGRCSNLPVKVDPVVPVSLTRWYSPILERGRSSSTRKLCLVRPSIRSPRRAGRSTSTSWTPPTRARFFCRAWSRTTPMSRSSRSEATW